MPWVNNPHAVHQHYLRIGNGWEVWSTARVRGMELENERLRDALARIAQRAKEGVEARNLGDMASAHLRRD